MIIEKVEAVREAIAAGGIPAHLDARDVHPPAAWVSAVRAEDFTMCMEPTVTVDIVLIAGDAGIRHSLTALDEMLDDLLEILSPVVASIESVSLSESATLSGVGSPLPAFIVTVTI